MTTEPNKNEDRGAADQPRRRPKLKMPRSYLVGTPMDEPRKLPARNRSER